MQIFTHIIIYLKHPGMDVISSVAPAAWVKSMNKGKMKSLGVIMFSLTIALMAALCLFLLGLTL